MTQELFRDDAYLRACQARVLESSAAGLLLDATVFYPLGGGQPGDSGFLNWNDRETRIVNTVKGGAGTILHVPADGTPLPDTGRRVEARIDWRRRYRHMRMHTCLHLLGALVPFGVTGGNIGEQKSRLDFDMDEIPDKEDLTHRLNALIAGDHPVQSGWITEEELDAQPELVRTMSVRPPRGAGRIRLMKIPGIDLQPCGGTHVRRTGEIGRARIGKIEKKGRHNRRIYVLLD